MNNTYYKNLDENFEQAVSLVEKDFTHEDMIFMLSEGNIPEKQIAALRLDTLKSESDAEILIKNLIGQDGKIREAVSLKIKEFAFNNEYRKILFDLDDDFLSDYFLAAIIDINGNICRNIIDVLACIKSRDNFVQKFCAKLIELIYELFDKIKEFDFKDGKYKVNKEIFKLYWCLEALNVYYDKIPASELRKILKVSKAIDEYTIREKTAKILSNDINDTELLRYREELKQDKNYYVRRILEC